MSLYNMLFGENASHSEFLLGLLGKSLEKNNA
jgi:hypothetical protein